MYRMYGFRMVTYLSVVAGLASIFSHRGYVAFRAPIGVSLCNMDRFLLPRAWVPAINMLIAFVPGALLPPLMFVRRLLVISGIGCIGVHYSPFMKMFVKLSHHYQRGTQPPPAICSWSRLLVGMAVACHLMDKAQIYICGVCCCYVCVFSLYF